MRLHTTATLADVRKAARFARVDLVSDSIHGSRKSTRAYEVKLEGDSRRRPNGGASGAGSGYAATWDQWGVFLSVLFTIDPEMSCWAYANAADFHWQTDHRFDPSAGSLDMAGSYWPVDEHGDHRFQPGAVGSHSQECSKCSAVKRWSVAARVA